MVSPPVFCQTDLSGYAESFGFNLSSVFSSTFPNIVMHKGP